MNEQEPGAADNPKGGQQEKRSSAGRIPRDAWVAEVVGDAANPQPVQLLTGYVGDAAEEGRTRIYFDASLASYVDVADEDVLRYEALEGDHRPAGGAMIWLRAQQPAAAAGADFFAGPVMQQHMAAARGAEPVHITLLTVPGCFTQQAPCPPLTRTFFPPCTFPFPIPRPTRIHPVCSWVCQAPGGFGQPGGLGGFNPDGTINCPSFGCPTYLDCPRPWDQGKFVYPQQQQQAFMAGPAPVGPTGWQGCTQAMGCPDTSTCAPGAEMAAAGPAQTTFTVCTQIGCQTGLLGCPPSSTCPPPGPIGQTAWLGCSHLICPPPNPVTMGTHCFFCPPNPTVATRCFICPPHTVRC